MSLESMKRIVIDLDHTLCIAADEGQAPTDKRMAAYERARPVMAVVERLKELHKQGFEIVINTSRNMRTFNGVVGRINIHTLPRILAWLDTYNIPYDEVIVGKPWCGKDGFYVDDRSIRPSEFARLSLDEINALFQLEEDFIDES